jgi:hypothetical protein
MLYLTRKGGGVGFENGVAIGIYMCLSPSWWGGVCI